MNNKVCGIVRYEVGSGYIVVGGRNDGKGMYTLIYNDGYDYQCMTGFSDLELVERDIENEEDKMMMDAIQRIMERDNLIGALFMENGEIVAITEMDIFSGYILNINDGSTRPYNAWVNIFEYADPEEDGFEETIEELREKYPHI